MNKGLVIGGFAILGFAIWCGFLANGHYHDPVGVGLLIGWGVFAGFVIGISFNGEDEPVEDTKHHKHID